MAGEADQLEGADAGDEDLDDLNVADAADDEQPGGDANDGNDDGEGDELVIELEGEGASPAPGEDNSTIREMRAALRAKDAEVAKLRAQLQPAAVVDPGPKPTLESCGWDEAVYEQSLDAWKEAEALHKEHQRQAEAVQQKAAEAWQADLTRYATARAAVRVPDYQDAEERVQQVLPAVAQAVILKAADNPAHVVLALDRHPAKLNELAKIEDPIKLAAAIVKLEGKLSVKTGRRVSDPEVVPRGDAAPGRVDQTLARLEREADRTGDRTKVIRYKRQLAERRA